MLRPKLITIFLLGLLVFASPAFAAGITSDGATQLQARFTRELAARKDMKAAGMKSSFTGDVTVVARDSYYQTTLPALKLTDDKNNVVNVGKIVMNMIPTDNADEWKSSAALPASMMYQDAGGKEIGTLSLGSQKASGLWDMKLFGMRKLDSTYDKIAYKNAQTHEGFTASELTASYDFAKSDSGFSGPVNVTANDVALLDRAGNAAILSPKIKVQTQVKSDKSAPKGYTQTSQAEVTGIGNALNVIGTKLKDPNASGKGQMQKALGILSILQMSGKSVAGNADTRTYDVVTDAQGRTTLNGVDVSLLLGAASIK